jgi:lipopolysaccharide/colanic/teichoic acid biosynthesis glycosyltransferase
LLAQWGEGPGNLVSILVANNGLIDWRRGVVTTVESGIPPERLSNKSRPSSGRGAEFARNWIIRAAHTARGRRLLVSSALLSGDLAAAILFVALLGHFNGLPAARAALASLPLLFVSLWILGLYGAIRLAPFERLRYRALATLAFGIGYFLVSVRFSTPGAVQALQLLLFFALGFYGEIFTRSLLIGWQAWGAPTAFVGISTAAKEYRLLSLMPQLGLRPVGRLGTRVASASNDRDERQYLLLGKLEQLRQIAGAEIEFLVTTNKSDYLLAVSTAKRVKNSPEVVLLSNGSPSRQQKSFLTSGSLNLTLGGDLRTRPNRLAKRAIDLAVAIPASLLALPIIGLLALAIRMIDRGPIFYFQTRVGHKGCRFRFIKLRTMLQDADAKLEAYLSENRDAREEWRRYCKMSRDPRVLPHIGNVMRRLSLDELPQLWHVITGEMSLVGPRPFPEYHASRFDPEFQFLRTAVPPGLTGLWQVSSRSTGDIELQKVEDQYYLQNWSIWIDLYVLLLTPPALLTARTVPKGVTAIPSGSLPPQAYS